MRMLVYLISEITLVNVLLQTINFRKLTLHPIIERSITFEITYVKFMRYSFFFVIQLTNEGLKMIQINNKQGENELSKKDE